MAGIGDQCSNRGVKQFTEELRNFSATEGYCMYGAVFFFSPKYVCFLPLIYVILLEIIANSSFMTLLLTTLILFPDSNSDYKFYVDICCCPLEFYRTR